MLGVGEEVHLEPARYREGARKPCMSYRLRVNLKRVLGYDWERENRQGMPIGFLKETVVIPRYNQSLSMVISIITLPYESYRFFRRA